jgi:hypothetical protein
LNRFAVVRADQVGGKGGTDATASGRRRAGNPKQDIAAVDRHARLEQTFGLPAKHGYLQPPETARINRNVSYKLNPYHRSEAAFV